MDTHRDVSRIVALGVLGVFKYDVPFGDGAERMRVIYAPNGRGKTNFLRAVSLALNPGIDSLQAMIEIPIRQLSIEFRSGASVHVTRKEPFSATYTATANPPSGSDLDPVSITVEPSDFAGRLYRRAWDEREEYIGYQTLVGSFTGGSSLLGDDRLAPPDEAFRDSARPSPPGVDRRRVPTVSRSLERVEKLLTQGALNSLSRESRHSGVYAEITRTTLHGAKAMPASQAREDLENRIDDLLTRGQGQEGYGLLSLRQVRDIKQQMDSVRANDRNISTLHKILKPYLESLQDQVQTLTPTFELINTFVTAVNVFLDRKSLRFSASRGIELYGRDRTRLHPESLSSGERHLLLLLSESILATEERPLVIIDEPELSLGIDWQRKLLRQLMRCSSSADVQFLIASHSVQVMGEIEADIIQPDEE